MHFAFDSCLIYSLPQTSDPYCNRVTLLFDLNKRLTHKFKQRFFCSSRRGAFVITALCVCVCYGPTDTSKNIKAPTQNILNYCTNIAQMAICYTASYQMPVFVSILPISLQKIAPEKNHELHSNELAKGYTLIPSTIFTGEY